MTKFYRFFYRLFARPFRRMYRIEIRGAENEILDGPVLVCANHTAFSDPIVLDACLHRQLRFFAKAELLKIPVLRHLFRALGAFPVHRGSVDVHAIKQVLAYLKDGEAVGIFPQGTRCPGVDPASTEPKNGIAMMAYRAKCSVLPIGISTERRKLGAFRKTVITVGKPITPEEMAFSGGTPEEYTRVANLIFDRICSLCLSPEEMK